MKASKGFLVALSPVLLLGCAGEVERPTEDLTRATTLITQAERAGAQEFAAADLQQARDKLVAANRAVDDGEAVKAQRLAQQSAADAEVAAARAASGQAKKAADEVSRSVDTLREEADRNAVTTPAPSGVTR